MRSFRLESKLALAVVLGVSLILTANVILAADRGAVRTRGIGPRIRLTRPQSRGYDAWRYRTAIGLYAGGGALIAGSVGFGLIVAFGIGPAWMAVRRRALVTEKFADVDGQILWDPPTDTEGRHYLRVKGANGKLRNGSAQRKTTGEFGSARAFRARSWGVVSCR